MSRAAPAIALRGVRDCTTVLAHYSERRVENCLHSLLRWLGLSHVAFRTASGIALMPAVFGMTLSFLARDTDIEILMGFRDGHGDKFRLDASVWSGLSFVLGFLIVFRASMAYSRYWSGMTSIHLMGAEWFDAASSLVSFSACSKVSPETVLSFKNIVVRLFSLLHVSALTSLVDPGVDDEEMFSLQVIEPLSLDEISLSCFDSHHDRVEIVGHWIQQTIVRATEDKVVSAPPPIISRSLQELGNGMVKYHDALKAKSVQFPEMYQNMCDVLLGLYWIGAPFLITLYCNSPYLTFIFTFLVVFAFWSLSLVAKVIENPFSTVQVTKEVTRMQNEINAKLLLLIDPKVARAPEIREIHINDNTSSIAKLVPLDEIRNSSGHGSDGSGDISVQGPSLMEVSADRELPANLRVPGEGESINSKFPASMQVSADRELPANLRVPGGGESINSEIPASMQVSADRELAANLRVAGGAESINSEIPASMQVSADRELAANLRVPGGAESINSEIPGSMQVSADRELSTNLQVPGGGESSGTDRTESGRTLAQQPPPWQQRRSAPGPWHEAAPTVDTASTEAPVPLRGRDGPNFTGRAKGALGSTSDLGGRDRVLPHSPESLHDAREAAGGRSPMIIL